MQQTSFPLKKTKLPFGGELMKTREGRKGSRPLAVRKSMHLVLRSSKATGEWSFKRKENEKKIRQLVEKFSKKYVVKLISLAVVGNHLHFHIQLGNRHLYAPFIRALTSAIAMAVTRTSRRKKMGKEKLKFWDYRPFTRIVVGLKAILTLRDYIALNSLEAYGHSRQEARFFIAWNQASAMDSS
jgi:REP element-mobilizing transposase RayT